METYTGTSTYIYIYINTLNEIIPIIMSTKKNLF